MVIKSIVTSRKTLTGSHGQRMHCEKYCNFYLISWCASFVERHSFCIVLHESPEIMRNCAFPQNFHTRKSGEITTYFAVMSTI